MFAFLRIYSSILPIVVFMLFAVSSGVFGAVQVIIKQNPHNSKASDIFLKQPGSRKGTKFLTISDVFQSHYHAAEYHNNHLYIIKRRGGDPETDELWRYDRNGKGKKLWSGLGMDFRVRDDEGVIAVESPSRELSMTFRNSLYILKDGKTAKVFEQGKLFKSDLSFDRWDGHNLWVRDQDAVDISAFICINTDTMKTLKYDITHLQLVDADFELNAKSLLLAYSDYPVTFDTYSVQEFKRDRVPVNLYVYNLRTNKRSFIARSVAKQFYPRWIDAVTLEYDNPRGKGTIRKQLK